MLINFILQFVCAALISVGIFFIILEFRTKYDRTFIYFGTSLILLSLFAATDLWISPYYIISENPAGFLLSQKLAHVLCLGFVPFSISHILLLTNLNRPKVVRGFFIFSAIFGLLFFTNYMIYLEPETFNLNVSLMYNISFVPFMLTYIVYAIWVIVKALKKEKGPVRKILKYQLLGFGLLFIAGIADIMDVVKLMADFPSYSIFGIFAYGGMAAWIFTEKFLLLLQERQENYKKLEKTYRQLEEVNGLKQLGESSAIVNHQIRNYMHQVSYWASVIERDEPISPRGMERLGHMNRMSRQILDFSKDILQMSRSHILENGESVDLTGMIKHVVDQSFHKYQESFIFEGLDKQHLIYGQWSKIEQVFINIFQNSIDATENKTLLIKVRILTTDSVIMVKIEDYGIGCTHKQEGDVFRAFFTTKKEKGGTGLGMALVRNIIECHGGQITAYTKNSEHSTTHGMRLIMTFPRFHAPESKDKDKKKEKDNQNAQIVLVQEEMGQFEAATRVLNNVHATPYVVKNATDVLSPVIQESLKVVLISPKAFLDVKNKLTDNPHIYLIQELEGRNYVMDNANEVAPEIFSEEFVLSQVVTKTYVEN